MGRRGLTVAVAAGVTHLLANAAHGGVHGLATVPVPAGTGFFVAAAVFGAPAVGLLAVAVGRVRAGGVVLSFGLLAALAYTVAYHFLLPVPDNVGHVHGPWSIPFGTTAVVGTVADAVGVVAGGSLALRGE